MKAAPVARSVTQNAERATAGPVESARVSDDEGLPTTSYPGPVTTKVTTNGNSSEIGGKNGGKSLLSEVVTDELPELRNLFEKAKQIKVTGQQIDGFSRGWRLERSGKYWRWRWQRKDATGNPVTYLSATGKTRYKRGSFYVGKEKPKKKRSSKAAR